MLQQRLDHGSARRLDRHRDLYRRRAGHLAKPGAQLSERGAAMGHVAFGDAFALAFEHATPAFAGGCSVLAQSNPTNHRNC